METLKVCFVVGYIKGFFFFFFYCFINLKHCLIQCRPQILFVPDWPWTTDPPVLSASSFQVLRLPTWAAGSDPFLVFWLWPLICALLASASWRLIASKPHHVCPSVSNWVLVYWCRHWLPFSALAHSNDFFLTLRQLFIYLLPPITHVDILWLLIFFLINLPVFLGSYSCIIYSSLEILHFCLVFFS